MLIYIKFSQIIYEMQEKSIKNTFDSCFSVKKQLKKNLFLVDIATFA